MSKYPPLSKYPCWYCQVCWAICPPHAAFASKYPCDGPHDASIGIGSFHFELESGSTTTVGSGACDNSRPKGSGSCRVAELPFASVTMAAPVTGFVDSI